MNKYNFVYDHDPISKPYFAGWLGGFIEAKGTFLNHKDAWSSFSICHTDYVIIEQICTFFDVNPKSIKKYKNRQSYVIEVKNLHSLNLVIDHCKGHLQGYKYYEMVKFLDHSKIFNK